MRAGWLPFFRSKERRGFIFLTFAAVIGGFFVAMSALRGKLLLLDKRKFLLTHDALLEPPRQDFIDAVDQAKDENNVVVVLSASFGYLPNVVNSMCSMKRVGIKRALMVALDAEIFKWATSSDFFVPVMLPGLAERGDLQLIEFGKERFADVSMEKFMSVKHVLATGATAVFSDGDIVYCRNPVPELLAMSKAASPRQDIMFQTSYESDKLGGDYINTGLFIARPTQAARELFVRTMADWKISKINNQRAVNNRLCAAEKGGTVVYGRRRWFGVRRGKPAYCARDGLRAGFLDPERYPNGPTRTRNVLTKRTRAQVRKRCDRGEATALHGNYIVGEMKELRFQAKGLWYASPNNSECLDSPIHPNLERLKTCGRACKSWIADLDDD